MVVRLLALLLTFWVTPALAQFNGCKVGFCNPATVTTYQGPGDVVSGATAWYGLRAYNAAYASPGTNKSVNLRRASDNASCDFVIATTGGLGGTASACSQGSGLSLAAFATTDATASCTIATTTATCTGASSTPHIGSTISTTGATAVTQPCYVTAVGTFTGGAGTLTVAGNGATSPCGTISVAETLTLTYGLYIAEAYDQSGSGLNLSQATAGTQPELLPSCINSLPCLLFSGSQGVSGATLTASAQPWTFVAAASNVTAAGDVISTSGTFENRLEFTATSAVGTYAGSGPVTAATVANSFDTMIGVANGSSGSISVDAAITSGNAGSNTLTSRGTTLNLGTGSTATLNGKILEGGVYGSGLSSGQQTSYCHNDRLYYGFSGTC
jgi:hypothetical protein